jgi:xylulokinase
VRRILLIGGAARSRAVQQIAPALFEAPVAVPQPGEYVADGAARQAAWVLAGGAAPPAWPAEPPGVFEADPTPAVRAAYAAVRDQGAPAR